MLVDVDEIKSLLQSEKPTVRKKGKIQLEDDVIKKKVTLTSYQTMTLVYAVMNYEKKEIDALQSKGKTITADSSQFFKQFIRYCSKYGQFISSKMVELIEDTLDVLYDKLLPASVKSIHKSIFSDLLEPKNAFAIPFESKQKRTGWKKFFIYLKEVMIDKKSASDAMNLKLLKGICNNLYNDFHYQTLSSTRRQKTEDEMALDEQETIQCKAILIPIIDWFRSLLKFIDDKDENSLSLLSTILECLTNFLKFFGFNLLNVFMEHNTIEDFFKPLIKYYFQFYSYPEKHFESFNVFISCFLDVFYSFEQDESSKHIFRCGILDLSPFYYYVTILYEGLLSEEFLVNVLSVTKKRQLQQQNRATKNLSQAFNTSSQSYQNLLEECPLLKLFYENLSRIIFLYTELFNKLEGRNELFKLEVEIPEKAEEPDSPLNKRTKIAHFKSNGAVGITFVLQKFASLILSGNSTVESSFQEPRRASSIKKHLSRSEAGGINFLLLESLLWLSISIFDEFPRNVSLINGARESFVDHIYLVNQWLTILVNQMVQSFQFTEEKQVLGAFCRLFSVLIRISSDLFSRLYDKVKKHENASGQETESLETEISSLISRIILMIIEDEDKFFKKNNRLVPLDQFHSELFKLLVMICQHAVIQHNYVDLLRNLISSISTWKVFKIQHANYDYSDMNNSANTGEAVDTVDIDINISRNEEIEANSVSNGSYFVEKISCPYYLKLLDRVISASSEQGNVGLSIIKAWVLHFLDKPTSLNFFNSSLYLNLQQDSVFDAVKLISASCLFPRRNPFQYTLCLHPVSQESWFMIKDLHWFATGRSNLTSKVGELSRTNICSEFGSDCSDYSQSLVDFIREAGQIWIFRLKGFELNSTANRDSLVLFYRVGAMLVLLMHFLQQFEIEYDLLINTSELLLSIVKSVEEKFSLFENLKDLTIIFHCLLDLKGLPLSVEVLDLIQNSIFNVFEQLKTRSRNCSSLEVTYNHNALAFDDDFEDVRDGGNSNNDWNNAERQRLTGSSAVVNVSSSSSNAQHHLSLNLVDSIDFLFTLWIFLSGLISNCSNLISKENKLLNLKLRFLTFLGEYIHVSYKDSKFTEGELILICCETYSTMVSTDYNFIIDLIQTISWRKIHLEWEHFAYLKLFKVIYNCFSKTEFWKENDRSNILINNSWHQDPFLKFTISKLLPPDIEEGSQEDGFIGKTSTQEKDILLDSKMLADHWFLREYQLKNVVILLKSFVELPTALKTGITSIFLAAFHDVDYRIRWLACKNFYCLFKHFKNPVKVYKNFYQSICEAFSNLSWTEEQKEHEPFEFSNVFLFFSHVFSDTGHFTFSVLQELVPVVLRDLYEFVYVPFSDQNSRYRLIFLDLLLKTLNQISVKLEYRSKKYLLMDYLPHLLFVWIRLLTKEFESKNGISELPRDLSFKDFPYEALFEDYFYDGLWEKRREFLLPFLTDFGHFILSAILSITDSTRIRWIFLTSYCRLIYGNDSDAEINKTISSNLISCKAYEMISHVQYQFLANFVPNDSQVTKFSKKYDELRSFLSRVIPNQKEVVFQIRKDLTGVILHLVLSTAFYSDDGSDAVSIVSQASSGSTSTVEIRRQYLLSLMDYLKQLLNIPTLNHLFHSANVLDLITNIFFRLNVSNYYSGQLSLLSFFMVLLENSDVLINQRILLHEIWKCFYFALLNNLSAENHSSELISDIFLVIYDFYSLYHQKIMNSRNILSQNMKETLMKDMLFNLLLIYIFCDQRCSGRGNNIFPLNSYQDTLNYFLFCNSSNLGFDCAFRRTVFACFKKEFTVILEKYKTLICSAISSIQADVIKRPGCNFLLLIPRLFRSFIDPENKIIPNSDNETANNNHYFKPVELCQEAIKETCSDILSGFDVWSNLLFLLFSFEELLESHLNDEFSQKSTTGNPQSQGQLNGLRPSHDTYKFDKQVLVLLISVCDFVNGPATSSSFVLQTWPTDTFPLMIANILNKLKYFECTKTFLWGDGSITENLIASNYKELDYYDFRPLNNPIKSSEYNHLRLQKNVVLLTYKFVSSAPFSSVSNSLSYFPVASNVLNALAVQTYFNDDTNSQGSSSNGTESADQSQIVLAPGQDCYYDNISLAFRQSPNNSNYLLKYNPFYDQQFGYLISDGDYELYQAFVCKPADFLWNDNLWKCGTRSTDGLTSTKRRSYASWIKRISYCLVEGFLLKFKSLQQSKPAKLKGNKSGSVVSTSDNKLIFLLSCTQSMCLISCEISEILFLLVLSEAIDILGVNSEFVTRVFEFIKKYMISTEVIGASNSISSTQLPNLSTVSSNPSIFKESKQLVSHLFTLLLQKSLILQPVTINEIGEIQAINQGLNRKQNSTDLLNLKFGLQYHTDIDLLSVSRMLLESDLFCSSLLFG
jgi:hypothetical protein